MRGAIDAQAKNQSQAAAVKALKHLMDRKMSKKSPTSSIFIIYMNIDFSTEIEMESFLHLMEKHGDEFYKKLKKHGLIRWRINQIWNKAGGFALSSIFEYRDQNAFEKSMQKFITLCRYAQNKVNMQ